MQDEEIIEEITEQNILKAKGLTPIVFDGYDLNITQTFNTLTIHLDGKLLANLNWNESRELAKKAIANGFAIFWNIDLGLFDQLNLPIDNQTQLLSLGLSLDHFKTTLWQEFSQYSVGISIFRGHADFSLDFCWNENHITNLRAWLKENIQSDELLQTIQDQPLDSLRPNHLYATEIGKKLLALFCRDVSIEYLSLLASRLPDSIPCYLFLDTTSISNDITKQIQLLNPDRYEFLHLALKGTSLPFNSWGWHSHATNQGYVGANFKNISKASDAQIGICLPLGNYYASNQWEGFRTIIDYLFNQKLNFKLIAESQLITQWDGLDYLFYNPEGLSPQGKRKLLGFCAAGGQVVSTGKLLGLPYEIILEEWLQNHVK